MLDEPVVAVHIPPQLRRFTHDRDEAMASGDTVMEVFESLDREFPGVLENLVLSDGAVAPGLEVWLGGTDIRDLSGLKTPVGLEEVVAIVPAGLTGERPVLKR
jgi:molybdopterin converting factor small subunit